MHASVRFSLLLLLTIFAEGTTVSIAAGITPYKAKEIQPYQSHEIKPYVAQDISAGTGRTNAEANSQPTRPQDDSSAGLIGVYSTNVGGGTYIIPSGTPGYGVLHTSAGAKSGALTLRSDHTYTWNAYGGKQGTWQETSRPDYPIALDDKAEKKRWLVGTKRGDASRINIWDGNAYNYVGTRVE